MRHLVRLSTFVVLGSLALEPATVAAEEQLQIPQPSPKASAAQRVGVTDFSIEYSSPAVKGRKIWGGLVPYDKAWRAGANASTKLTASRDFKLGTTAVKAGSYSVFMIPGDKSWTVILNSDVNAGGNHDAAKDIARVTVTAATLAQPRERLTYLFSDTTDEQTALDLEWESVRVRVPLAVDTRTHVLAGIDATLADAWRPHFTSAGYLFQIGQLPRAQQLVAKSISIKPTYRNEWLNAQILWKSGKKAPARAAAQRALKLGPGDPGFEAFWKGEITKTIATWK
jgi:hypothetical protein